MTAMRRHVDRVVFALDCGVMINPDLIRQQAESGILYGLGATAWGEIVLGELHVAWHRVRANSGGRPPGRKFQQRIDMGERAWSAAKPSQPKGDPP
jgi:hypothetical protein